MIGLSVSIIGGRTVSSIAGLTTRPNISIIPTQIKVKTTMQILKIIPTIAETEKLDFPLYFLSSSKKIIASVKNSS